MVDRIMSENVLSKHPVSIIEWIFDVICINPFGSTTSELKDCRDYDFKYISLEHEVYSNLGV